MRFGNKSRVEEDLERIRQANLPDAPAAAPPEAEAPLPTREEEKVKLTAKDLLAMVLAVLSLVLPYFLVLCGVLAVVFLVLGRFYGA